MISVKVTINRNGAVRALSVLGHAADGEHSEGSSDIVCAAVTALMEAALQGLTEIEKLELDYSVVNNLYGDSMVEFQLPRLNGGYQAARVNFLMSTVYASLKRIEERYPEFIHVEEVLPRIGKNKGSNRKRLDADTERRADRKSAH